MSSDYDLLVIAFIIGINDQKIISEEKSQLLKQKMKNSKKMADITRLCKELNFETNDIEKLNKLWKEHFNKWVDLWTKKGGLSLEFIIREDTR